MTDLNVTANSLATEIIGNLKETLELHPSKIIDKKVFDGTLLKLIIYVLTNNKGEDIVKIKKELLSIWYNYTGNLSIPLTIIDEQGNKIINISSASTVKKGRGIVTYASAKAGLETFTRTLAQEVGRKNIRVNCIRPGIIETAMSQPVIFRLKEQIEQFNSMGRIGQVQEVSKMVLCMASENVSSYLTGECITIDGGAY